MIIVQALSHVIQPASPSFAAPVVVNDGVGSWLDVGLLPESQTTARGHAFPQGTLPLE